MKKIIRLTERDLTRIVKQIIKEDITNPINLELIKSTLSSQGFKNSSKPGCKLSMELPYDEKDTKNIFCCIPIKKPMVSSESGGGSYDTLQIEKFYTTPSLIMGPNNRVKNYNFILNPLNITMEVKEDGEQMHEKKQLTIDQFFKKLKKL